MALEVFVRAWVIDSFSIYTNEFKSWEFGKAGAAGLKQRSGAEAVQLE